MSQELALECHVLLQRSSVMPGDSVIRDALLNNSAALLTQCNQEHAFFLKFERLRFLQ